MCHIFRHDALAYLTDWQQDKLNFIVRCAVLTQSRLTRCFPMSWSPPGCLSMGCPRQEYQSGLPCPSPGDLPYQGLSLHILHWQAGSVPQSHLGALYIHCAVLCCAWSLSPVWLFAAPRTVASRRLCPWGFSRQEYWSGLPFPPPANLPNPGIEPRSLTLQAACLTIWATRETLYVLESQKFCVICLIVAILNLIAVSPRNTCNVSRCSFSVFLLLNPHLKCGLDLLTSFLFFFFCYSGSWLWCVSSSLWCMGFL